MSLLGDELLVPKVLRLVDAISMENCVLLSELLMTYDPTEESACVDASAALKVAADHNYIEGAEILLVGGVDPNWRDLTEFEIPLTVAAARGHVDMLRLLLKFRTDVNCSNSYGTTALHKAVQAGKLDCIELLLEYEANCNAKDVAGTTPIINASELNSSEPLQLLLRCGKDLDVNHRTEQGNSALKTAVERNSGEVVKLLLARGADPNLADADYRTCVHMACLRGHYEILKILLNMGGNPNLEDRVKHTPVFEAAWQGHVKCIELLLEHGARVDLVDRSDYFPLAFAALNGHIPVVKLLLDAGCPINQQGYSKNTALHEATWNGWSKTVEYLLSRGANPNLQDINGATPLFKSLLKRDVQPRDIETLRALLLYNTDLELRGKSVYTHICDSVRYLPLQLALLLGNVPAAMMMIIAGARLAPVARWFLMQRVPSRLQKNPEHYKFVMHAALNTRSLRLLCRTQIRRAMGPTIVQNIHSLPLPTVLRDYILLKDLDQLDFSKYTEADAVAAAFADDDDE